mgnify:CR=1 FL=1
MERLTKWNESSHKHAYYPRCFTREEAEKALQKMEGKA